MPGDTHAIHRMKEMWCYMAYVFDDCKRNKSNKKSQKVADYKSAVDIFFNVAKLTEKDYILFSKNSDKLYNMLLIYSAGLCKIISQMLIWEINI